MRLAQERLTLMNQIKDMCIVAFALHPFRKNILVVGKGLSGTL
jgi:hypothetical protein